ncbi:MAG: hypothetical protein OYG32_12520 [Rhodospirillaceae bacterium]|nr:hypothetical protein [Rhodospirillaceae bacterium]
MTAIPKLTFESVVFAYTECDATTLSDVQDAMQQVMNHPAKPVTKVKSGVDERGTQSAMETSPVRLGASATDITTRFPFVLARHCA